MADPGEWDIDGPKYQEHFSEPAFSPPVGDEAWMNLSRKQQQDLMWSTPVYKGADAAWPDTPEERMKEMERELERKDDASIRAWSDTTAFKEYLKKLPEGTNVYHLKDGTTIFHRPKNKNPALTS